MQQSPTTKVSILLAGMVVAVGLDRACWGQHVPARSAQQRLARALSSETKFEFLETPIADAVAFLERQHGIAIQVDRGAMTEARMSRGVNITANVKGISLGAALLVTLRNVGWVAVMREGVLLITTPARAGVLGGVLPGLTTPKPPIKAGPNARGNKVLDALKDHATFEFVETCLEDVVERLEHQHNIPIFLDQTALREARLSRDLPVTQNLRGISLRSALLLTLGQVGLTCARQDEFLIITTPRKAKFWGGAIPPVELPPKKLSDALKHNTRRDFIETPLDEVVAFLRDEHHIPIVIDHPRLKAAGWGDDVPITANVKNATVESALQRMLDRWKLTYVIEHETVVITTQESRKTQSLPNMKSQFEDQKFLDALEDETRFEFVETPLDNVIAFVKDFHHIEIQIDRRALSEANISPEIPITANIKGVSLRASLLITLRNVGLVAVVQEGFLLITTPEKARHWGGVLPGLTTPNRPLKSRSDASPNKVLDALEDDTRLEFIETPLEQVVNFLRDQHDIPILFDMKALRDAKISPQVPVTQNIKWISLRSAIQLMLRQLGLTCARHDEFLVITTSREAEFWGGAVPLVSSAADRVNDALKGDTARSSVLPARRRQAEKIDYALRSDTRIQFIETPLEDVVEFMKDLHSIPIFLDKKAIRDMGLDPNVSVTRNIRGISLHSALVLMLRELGLTCARHDEFLVITTPRETEFWGDALQRLDSPAEKMDVVLKEDTRIEFRESPLQDVVRFLCERHGIPIFLDLKALRAAKVDPATPVTENLKGISLRSGLLLMLRQLDLTCACQNEFLVITTPNEADFWGHALRPSVSRPDKIDKALKGDTVFEFIQCPLREAVQYLRDRHDIPIIIDRRALADAGIRPDVPITRNIKRVPLGSALRLMLDELKLTYVVENEVLLITTPKSRKTETTLEGRIGDGIRSLPTYRTWKDITGRYSTEAQFVRESDGKVILRKTDGSTVVVPLDRLSAQDQQWVRSLRGGP